MGISIAQYEQMLAENPEVKANEQGATAPTEAQEQIRLIAWVDANMHICPQLRWLFHPANGEYRHPATAGRLKAMGVRPGVPDIILPVNSKGYVGMAIELKRSDGSNKATAGQSEWLHFLRREGWQTHVCYGAAEAIAAIKQYMGME